MAEREGSMEGYRVEIYDTTKEDEFGMLEGLLSRPSIRIHSIHTAGAVWASDGSGGEHHWVTVVFQDPAHGRP